MYKKLVIELIEKLNEEEIRQIYIYLKTLIKYKNNI